MRFVRLADGSVALVLDAGLDNDRAEFDESELHGKAPGRNSADWLETAEKAGMLVPLEPALPALPAPAQGHAGCDGKVVASEIVSMAPFQEVVISGG